MSIAPGVPLKLVAAPRPRTSASASLASNPDHLTAFSASCPVKTSAHLPIPSSLIVASPTALAAHSHSTAATHALPNPSSSPPIPPPTHHHHHHSTPPDLEDLHTALLPDHTTRRRPPVVPFYCPHRAQLQVGRRYLWCACGRSGGQPWCDGQCGPGDPEAVEFAVGVEQRYWYMCGCKYTSRPPFCDGSHIHAVVGAEELRARQARAKGGGVGGGDDSHAAAPPVS